MAIEIEHKYLVVNESYKHLESDVIEIRQGYLSRNPQRTVRVRTWNQTGYLTVKGITRGSSRKEYEYEIPYKDALDMLMLCEPPIIHKCRHILDYKGHRWEVDEFHGDLAPLITAEIELTSENEEYVLPPFVGANVTGDPRYYNSALSASSKKSENANPNHS